MELWTEIRCRVLGGELSKRAACSEYDLHWDTLNKILQHVEPPGYRQAKPRARPTIEPFLPTIHEILEGDRTAPRNQSGKGMVICIDKVTAVKMYDKVQKYWKAYLGGLKAELAAMPGPSGTASGATITGRTDGLSLAAEPPADFNAAKRQELQQQIDFMEQTDMAVIVSSQQNEVEDFKAKGLDIEPHRNRMAKEDMETKFKDADDPFRLVFVCAMWLTGFDNCSRRVPSHLVRGEDACIRPATDIPRWTMP